MHCGAKIMVLKDSEKVVLRKFLCTAMVVKSLMLFQVIYHGNVYLVPPCVYCT